MLSTVGVGLLGAVIGVGSVVSANDSRLQEELRRLPIDGTKASDPLIGECPQEIPAGFYWRQEDVPQALKQRIEVCWTYADVAGRPRQWHEQAVSPELLAPRLPRSSTLFDEALRHPILRRR